MKKREITAVNRIILHNSGCLKAFHYSISKKGNIFKGNDLEFSIRENGDRDIEVVIEGEPSDVPTSEEFTALLYLIDALDLVLGNSLRLFTHSEIIAEENKDKELKNSHRCAEYSINELFGFHAAAAENKNKEEENENEQSTIN